MLFFFSIYFEDVRLHVGVGVGVVDFVSTLKLGNSGRWGGGKTIKTLGKTPVGGLDLGSRGSFSLGLSHSWGGQRDSLISLLDVF